LEIKIAFVKKLRADETRECLLLFSPEAFVFQFVIKKYKDSTIQNYDFACCLCGCRTWLVTLREEHRLRVFENRVLRRILGLRGMR